MEAEIESSLGINSQLIVGSGGCFEVVADGKVVFSKNESGRFPENSEVIASLRELTNIA